MENKRSPYNDKSFRDSPIIGRQYNDGCRYPYPEDPTRVYVGNLPSNVSVEDVKRLFINKVGAIDGLFVGREKDYIFLKFQTIDMSSKAIKLMNDYPFFGSILKVQKAYARNGRYQNNSYYNDNYYYSRRGSRDDSNNHNNQRESSVNDGFESYVYLDRYSNGTNSRSRSGERSKSRNKSKRRSRSRERSKSRSLDRNKRNKNRRSKSRSKSPNTSKRQRSRSRSQSSPRNVSNFSKKRNRSSTRSKSRGDGKRESKLCDIENSKSIIPINSISTTSTSRTELNYSNEDFTPRTPPTIYGIVGGGNSFIGSESYDDNNGSSHHLHHHHNNDDTIGNTLFLKKLQQTVFDNFNSQFNLLKGVVDKILENQLKFHNEILTLVKNSISLKSSTSTPTTSKQSTNTITTTTTKPITKEASIENIKLNC
ncbi:hypothetical protein ACTA71_001161 [Dictyostelium dimigraforme]